jgi:hypothetical protein
MDKRELAREYLADNDEDEGINKNPVQAVRSKGFRQGDITLLFEDKDQDTIGLLTKENLIMIYEMEEKVLKDPLWPMICRAQDDTNKTCHNETSFMSCLKVFEEVGAFNRSDVYKIS